MYIAAVMLSEAKHLGCLPMRNRSAIDQRWKAWPRGLRPLRCSFASLRMTIMKSLLDINSHRHCPGDILPTGALPEFSTSQIIVGHQDKSAHDANPA